MNLYVEILNSSFSNSIKRAGGDGGPNVFDLLIRRLIESRCTIYQVPGTTLPEHASFPMSGGHERYPQCLNTYIWIKKCSCRAVAWNAQQQNICICCRHQLFGQVHASERTEIQWKCASSDIQIGARIERRRENLEIHVPLEIITEALRCEVGGGERSSRNTQCRTL